MTIYEAIEYWDGLRKTFSNRLEKEENCFGRMHFQTTIDVLDITLSCLQEQEERRWIPVSDPPKEKGCYFVTVKHWYDGKPVAREAYWNGADWLSCEKRQEITPRVTHWMPLPEPPKED